MKNNNYPIFSGNNPFASQAKMLCHIDRLYEYIVNGDTKPIFMEVNLTDFCNLKCSWCITNNRSGNKSLEINVLKKFIKEFKEFGGKAITFSGGGEPTTYNNFVEITEFTKSVGLDIGLMTNGFFNSAKIDCIGKNFNWIRISLDTANKKLYKSLKGIDAVDIIIENVKKFKNYPVKVGINCNVVKEYSIEDIKEFIDVMLPISDYLQFRPVLPRFFMEEKIELNEKVWDFLIKNDCEKINISNDKLSDIFLNKNFPFKYCEGHFFSPILQANGDVAVCMYHPNEDEFVFGNIYKNSFEEIWKSEKRSKVISFVKTIEYKNKCQLCCKLNEINKLIDFIKYVKVEDSNFL
jgi:GTP 3',8-cyclase